ncbi:hypothetical protein C8R43DRAFT_994521 [Mycena crocata]|nr:hypothetical protein C8R43DRAFT_994521 [Mycena crocata]
MQRSLHRSLKLHILSTLPVSIRRIASRAATGSVADLLRLKDLIEDIPNDQTEALLPVFYTNLDPERIPHVQELDTLPADVQLSVAAAWLSLKGISSVYSISVHALPDLWSRYWLWIRFFVASDFTLTFRIPSIPEVDAEESREEICFDLVEFLSRMKHHPAATGVMISMPDFAFVMAKTWATVSDLDDGPTAIFAYEILARFLFAEVKTPSVNFIDQLIVGAGGSCNALASLVRDFIRRFIPDREQPVSKDTIYFLGTLIDFIVDMEDTMLSRAAASPSMGPLFIQLLAIGFITSLTRVVYVLAHSSRTAASPVLRNSLALLCRFLSTSSDHELVASAIDAGLVHSIVACALAGRSHPQLDSLLDDILPPSLAYYSTLDSLEGAMAAVQEALANEAMSSEWLDEKWGPFQAVADERLEIMKHFHNRMVESWKACDNVECGKVMEHLNFRRCSACRNFYYCSLACQKVDWREGGHREICTTEDSFRLGENQNFSTRERTFFRDVLLTWDYEMLARTVIYPQKVLFMARHPGTPYFTLFDYTHGRVRLEVLALDGELALREFGQNAEWRHDVVRAGRSQGRMQLDVMAISAGNQIRYFLVPLRAESPHIHNTLERLARESPFARDPPDLSRLIEQIRSPELEPEFEGIIAVH